MTKGSGAVPSDNPVARPTARTRRVVLKGVALTAGLVGSTASLASTQIHLGSGQTNTAILADRLVELLRRFRPAGSTLTPSNRIITVAFDDLMNHLDQVYGDKPASPDEVRKALERSSHGPFSFEQQNLSRYPRSVVPLLVVRDLLRNHGLCMKPSASPAFAAFLRRHATALAS